MIEVKVKIHDKFSFEFKISFITNKNAFLNEKSNEFSINTWLFVPNNLGINRATYSKDQFYKDTVSNIRLITPVFSLKDIYDKTDENSPINQVKNAFTDLVALPDSQTNIENYTYQIRMFASICKSAVRDKVHYIGTIKENTKAENLVDEFITDIRNITRSYQDLFLIINQPGISQALHDHFFFGDDFVGNIVEQHTYWLMQSLESKAIYPDIKGKLVQLIQDGLQHKKEKKYSYIDEDNPTNNYLVIMRRGILKKYIESDLYLNTRNSKDGAVAEQLYYAIAAGVSMIFATIISFSAQLHYGNFTTPLFFALVISYAFKDRIKDLMRYYFSTQLGKKYFDTKRELEIRNQNIGWAKESFDFVSENKVPPQVLDIRKRTPLVEAENQIYNEKIILYKKLLNLAPDKIDQYKGYKFIGINDITRFNITHFIQKMDNPFVSLYLPDVEDGYKIINSEKVYTLHFVIRCESNNTLYFRKFRLLFNREGIKEITEIND